MPDSQLTLLTGASRGLGLAIAQDGARYAGVTFINNASVLAPLRSAADTDLAVLAQVLRVGLEAPLLLAAVFLHCARHPLIARLVTAVSRSTWRFAPSGVTILPNSLISCWRSPL